MGARLSRRREIAFQTVVLAGGRAGRLRLIVPHKSGIAGEKRPKSGGLLHVRENASLKRGAAK